MVTCPNCNTTNPQGAADCKHCGEKLHRRSWWRGILGTLSGQRAGQGPPRPKAKKASGQLQRLKLFTQWVGYVRGREETFVVFKGARGCPVSFSRGANSPGTWAVVHSSDWERFFKAPLPEPLKQRLIEKGFNPPDERCSHHYQVFDDFDPGTLARLAEWAFLEIFGEDEDFTVEVSGFGRVEAKTD